MRRHFVFIRSYVPRRLLPTEILHQHRRLFRDRSTVRASHFGELHLTLLHLWDFWQTMENTAKITDGKTFFFPSTRVEKKQELKHLT